jgi:bile acid-coenzyme A ligase
MGSSVIARLSELTTEHPERDAIIFAPQQGPERSISWRELDRHSNQIARLLADLGTSNESIVVVGVWNCPEHFLVTYGAWKLGALVLPLRAILPAFERDQILELANPAVVFADWDDLPYPTLRPAELHGSAAEYSDEPLPNVYPHPGKAIASGGSTGRSKIIIDRTWDPTTAMTGRSLGMEYGQIQLVAAPLYHNSPMLISHGGLMTDHTLVVMERFNAEQAVEHIERRRISYFYFPPILMRRLALLPGIEERDLSSIEAMHSSAAPCPPWLKRRWIELIGAEKVHEVYGSTEGIGATIVRGDEWLDHPGTIGRPAGCELKILDENGNELPPGEVGEIFTRTTNPKGRTFEYVGAPPIKTSPDDFASVGDLGWLDEDGYLYLADRRIDMIVSGGANVYPAEVEAALSDHPGLADIVVVGVPDEEWGRRVHAIVQPTDPCNPPDVQELDARIRLRLASYKAPKTYEFVTELPRNEAGKIRRTQLVTERESGALAGIAPVRG